MDHSKRELRLLVEATLSTRRTSTGVSEGKLPRNLSRKILSWIRVRGEVMAEEPKHDLSGVNQVVVFREKDQAESVEQVCNRWMKTNHEQIEILDMKFGWEPLHGAVILVWWRYK